MLKGRCGRKRISTDNESADAVMQDFARSPDLTPLATVVEGENVEHAWAQGNIKE